MSLRRLFTDLVVVLTTVLVIIYFYQNHWPALSLYLFGEQEQTIFINDVSLTVTIADEHEERVLGLSGTQDLGDTEGKLFVFDQEDYYAIWMKDMLFPIDIVWVNDDLKVVHIEENVSPDTFPASYRPAEPARFVIETNAFFVDTYKLSVGDRVTIPAADLPRDLKERLQ